MQQQQHITLRALATFRCQACRPPPAAGGGGGAGAADVADAACLPTCPPACSRLSDCPGGMAGRGAAAGAVHSAVWRTAGAGSAAPGGPPTERQRRPAALRAPPADAPPCRGVRRCILPACRLAAAAGKRRRQRQRDARCCGCGCGSGSQRQRAASSFCDVGGAWLSGRPCSCCSSGGGNTRRPEHVARPGAFNEGLPGASAGSGHLP